MSRRPYTEAQRLAATDLGRSYVVNAGAGSGKTRVLTDRYLNLVDPTRPGGPLASPSEIVALTFTTKAAREMLDRIRRSLQKRAAEVAGEAERSLWQSLREEMSRGRVETIHAFCAGLLREFPIEAGVDPEFLVMEEFAARELLEQAEREAILAEIDRDPAVRRLAVDRGLGPLSAELTGLYRAVRSGGESWDEVEQATRASLSGAGEAAVEDLRALFRLLRAVDSRYAALKGPSALDYDDLPLRVLSLLRDDPGLCRSLQRRFRYLLVDEFQDTDALQSQIITHLAGEDPEDRLFLVGDPKQSIYRFRNADVRLFLEWQDRMAEGLGGVIPLAENFRCQPALVGFVNTLFARLMGERFGPLVAARTTEKATLPAVELLLAEAAEGEKTGEVALREARLLAARLREMVEHGEELVSECPAEDEPERRRGVRYGDIALLFRTRGRLKVFEAALREQGVPYYVAGGSGFYRKAEVRDVLALLQAVDDPADHLALAAVLRSPLFDLPDDALLLLVQGFGDLGSGLAAAAQGKTPESLDPPTRDRLVRAGRLLDRARLLRSRLSLPDLMDLLLRGTDYEAALVRLPGGEQKLANLQKLRQVAGELAGGGHLTLTDFLAYFARLSERSDEAEAPLETEGSNTVKLLTIHAAKGLEFPVVAVVDLAGAFPREAGGWRYAKGRGLAPEPGDEEAGEARAELVRLLYVAATRAKDHLLLTGWVGPGGKGRENSWLGLILAALDGLELPEGSLSSRRSARDPEAPSRLAQSGLAKLDQAPPPLPPPLLAPVSWPGRRVAVTTVSELMCFAACPRRYHLQYRLQAPPVLSPRLERRGGVGPASPGLLPPDVRGTLVHRAVERLRRAVDLEPVLAEVLTEAGVAREEREAVAAGIRPLLAKYLAGEEFAALARGLVLECESPFFVRLGEGLLLHGAVDRVERDPGGLRLLDFKTNLVTPEEAWAEAAGYYRLQLPLYALAVRIAWREPVVSAAYVFLEAGARVEVDVSSAVQTEAGGEAQRLSVGIETGEREPIPSPACARCGYVPLCDAGRRMLAS